MHFRLSKKACKREINFFDFETDWTVLIVGTKVFGTGRSPSLQMYDCDTFAAVLFTAVSWPRLLANAQPLCIVYLEDSVEIMRVGRLEQKSARMSSQFRETAIKQQIFSVNKQGDVGDSSFPSPPPLVRPSASCFLPNTLGWDSGGEVKRTICNLNLGLNGQKAK